MRTKKPTATTALLLILLCIVIVAVIAGCQSQEPEPTSTHMQTQKPAGILVENAHSGSVPIISAPASLIQDYKRPPQGVQDFVNRSRAIVIGTVTAISEPVVERPYDFNSADFAGLPESQWPSIEVAYWTIDIEQVLLDDGNIEANPMLRMEPNPPHRPDKPLPQLNGRYLFTLGRNPDSLSYGISADWMILSLDGGDIRDLAGTAPGYVGVTGELSLVEGIRKAVPNHDFLPAGEWPSRFETGAGDAEGEPSAPGGPDDGESGPVGNTGEGES